MVRHSRATRVDISLSAGPAVAVAEITDNGPPAPDDVGPLTRLPADSVPPGTAPPTMVRLVTRPASGGSGLTGLGERVRGLGGELVAGKVEPHGFRLRVVVPLGPRA